MKAPLCVQDIESGITRSGVRGELSLTVDVLCVISDNATREVDLAEDLIVENVGV